MTGTPNCPACQITGCCQRKDNPPPACLREPEARSEGGLWVIVSRLERQERVLRAGAWEGGD